MKSLGIILSLLLAAVSAHFDINDIKVHSIEHLLGQPRLPLQRAQNIEETLGANKPTPAAEANREYWLNIAQEEVAARTVNTLNTKQAKNVIFFLGDGMSITTTTSARILKGQRKGNMGEEDQLSFEKFPYTGMSRTYCTNAQVADSACTATAYLCGVKGNIVTIGVNGHVRLNNCTESMNPANRVSSIAAWAQKAGKSTGFITTTTLTHASPAGAYAHVASRFWESDTDIIKQTQGTVDPATCPDIAKQLITQEPGSKFNVMMGGGMGKFLPNTIRDSFGNMGERSDGKNLLSTWQAMHKKGAIVTDRNGLKGLNLKKLSNIMGIFQSKYMSYHSMANETQEPTLEEMTETAIKFLSQNKKGYFIFIEGALIDVAHHENKAGLSLDETLEFDKAIKKAREMTDPNDTLIVVSADHSHPMSIAGYPGRGTDILGLNQHDVDENDLRYVTLNYATGPQQYLDERGNRLNLEGKIGKDHPTQTYPSYVKMPSGVHGGDDVAVYASGPWEHLFRGVLQQSTIPHLMAYASCMGDGPTMCKKK